MKTYECSTELKSLVESCEMHFRCRKWQMVGEKHSDMKIPVTKAKSVKCFGVVVSVTYDIVNWSFHNTGSSWGHKRRWYAPSRHGAIMIPIFFLFSDLAKLPQQITTLSFPLFCFSLHTVGHLSSNLYVSYHTAELPFAKERAHFSLLDDRPDSRSGSNSVQ